MIRKARQDLEAALYLEVRLELSYVQPMPIGVGGVRRFFCSREDRTDVDEADMRNVVGALRVKVKRWLSLNEPRSQRPALFAERRRSITSVIEK